MPAPAQLIPPWAERLPKERLLARHPPRAPPPPLVGSQAASWFERLDVNDKCEVFFEQGWQAARVDEKASDGALFVRVLQLVDDFGKYWTIKCNSSNLRPRTDGLVADSDTDDDDEEEAARGGVVGRFTSDDGSEQGRLADDDDDEDPMEDDDDEEDDGDFDEDCMEEDGDQEQEGTEEEVAEGEEGAEGQAEEERRAGARGDGLEADIGEGGEGASADEGERGAEAHLMQCAVESMDLEELGAYVPYLSSTCIFKCTAIDEMPQEEREAAKALLIKSVPPCDQKLVSGFLATSFNRARPFINHRNVQAALQKTTFEGGTSGSKLMEHLQLATLSQGSFGVIAVALIKLIPKGRKLRAVAAERASSAETSFLVCEVLFAAVQEQFEHQGVDTRLMMELAHLCRSTRYEVEHMLAFDRLVGERREGITSALCREVEGGQREECVDYTTLQTALGVGSLPEALLLPWPLSEVHAHVFNPGRVKAGRKQPSPRTPPETGSSSGGGRGTLAMRKLNGYEVCMGSGRLSKALARKGWEMTGVECEVQAPEYDGELLVHPTRGSGRIKLKVQSLRDMPVSQFPTLDYIHFSLNCTSVSNAAGGKHGRTEESRFLGTTPESQQYNQDLMHAFLIIKDQLARPGNAAFKFT